MHIDKKWYAVPPALALVLLLGPFRSTNDDQPTKAADTVVADKPSVGASIPDMPGTLQVVSTLGGVLLLGVAGLMVVAHTKGGNALPLLQRLGLQPSANRGATPSTAILEHRQSLRVSPKARLHVVRFDDTTLLLGEGEHGVSLLHTQSPNSAADDEAEALAGSSRGAEPIDVAQRTRAQARNGSQATRQRNDEQRLADFRTLLSEARKRIPS